MTRGFTLIETLIYLALLGVLTTGAIAALYSVQDAVAGGQTAAGVEDEGGFVLAKIRWAIASADALSVSDTGEMLTVRRSDAPTKLVFFLQGGTVYITEEDGADLPLTSARVTASGLSFAPLGGAGSAIGADISFFIDGAPFESREFLP